MLGAKTAEKDVLRSFINDIGTYLITIIIFYRVI